MNKYQEKILELKKEAGPLVINDAQVLKEKNGKITISDIFFIADKNKLPVKTTFNILEDALFIAYGTFERLILRGMKVRKVQAELGIKPVDILEKEGG